MIMKPFLSFVLALSGCAPTIIGLSVDDPEIYVQVQAAWGEDTFIPPYRIIESEDVQGQCATRRPIDGCGGDGIALIAAGLDPVRREMVILHEVGHLIRGTGGHLNCAKYPMDDVMCDTGGWPGMLPTDRDIAFVTGVGQ